MASLMLVIVYVAFISLGLPDSALGAAWPSMYPELGVPVSYAGIVSLIIAGGTTASSLMSDRVIRKFGTGIVTAFSVAATAISLIGFSLSSAFWMLCLWGVPYGLGAGSVDAALNNFVARHYSSRHMNWLHCFWGVGAMAGPYIMGLCLTRGLLWTAGYQVMGILQMGLAGGLIASLPLWRRKQAEVKAEQDDGARFGIGQMIRLPGAKPALIAFFCYCAVEVTAGLWASSYMVLHRGIADTEAAKLTAIFYLGITAGRFLSGVISGKLENRNMVRLGQAVAIAGIGMIMLPLGNVQMAVGLAMVGLGCAPIYPGLLHETPKNFGAERSQTIMGMQMASAYTGTTLAPFAFGFIAEKTGVALYPFFLMIFAAIMIVTVERLNKACPSRTHGVVPRPGPVLPDFSDEETR